jgi:glycosyltransferase involved in cell wall biosynthesis
MGGKKILILVENLPVPFDRRVWMESTALVEAGYQVSVICPKGKYPKYHEILEGVRIYRYPLVSLESVLGHFLEYAIAFFCTFLLTWVVFFREGFDIIQSANPPDFFFVIGGFFKLFGKKFIFDHHDLMPEICDSRWTVWKHRLTHSLSVWSERATFNTADWVISTNESYRQVAITRGKVPSDHVTVVRSGPSIYKFVKVPEKPGLKKGKKHLVCYLGVMGPNDGIEYLLQSIDYIVHHLNRNDIYFILMGGGDLQPKLLAQSLQLKLDPYVEFTGRIPDEQVCEIISTSDLGVAPDPKDPLNDVSTMNKIVEYMALGAPLVCFDLKEARVSAGEAAVYAVPNDIQDFGNKILYVIDHPEMKKKMGEFGFERFQSELAWEHQKVKLLDLYNQLTK